MGRYQAAGAVEGVGSLAGLDLHVVGEKRQALGFREPHDGRSLGFDAEAGAPLAGSRDAIVGNSLVHEG
jgi:hypothetical protein